MLKFVSLLVFCDGVKFVDRFRRNTFFNMVLLLLYYRTWKVCVERTH